jgi:hypothetical protein
MEQRQRKTRRLTPTELRIVAFVATLALAALAIVLKVETTVVWAFLGVAVGRTLPDLSK